MTMARAGQPLSEVASQADVFIRALEKLDVFILGKHGEKPLDIGLLLDTQQLDGY